MNDDLSLRNQDNTHAWHSSKAVCIDGKYYNTPFLKEVVAELSKKAFYAERGFAEFSKADMLVLHILKERFMLDLPAGSHSP